jgi:CRP-like cAMP-binding protein
MLGLTALGSGQTRDATALALDPVRAMEIDAGRLESMIRQGSELATALVKLLVDRMSDFHHRVGQFLAQSVDYRLAVALLAISRPDPSQPDNPTSLEIPLTHEELAQLIGSRRPTISSTLSRFRETGLVERQTRALRIADRAGLERLVAELET